MPIRSAICALVAALLLPIAALAQTDSAEARNRRIAGDFIAAYNRQDYEGMRAAFGERMKGKFPPDKMARHWGDRYKTLGAILNRIDEIRAVTGAASTALRYAADTAARELLVLNINTDGQIQSIIHKPDPYTWLPSDIPARPREAAVDSVLAACFPKGFSGTVLYASGGAVVFQKNAGYNNLTTRVPVNDSSVFELASCSKQFTAAAILRLQELGKLRLDDSLRKFFPQLPYSGVTVRHLVHHTAGLPEYDGYLGSDSVKKPFVTNTDVIAMLPGGKAGPPSRRAASSSTPTPAMRCWPALSRKHLAWSTAPFCSSNSLARWGCATAACTTPGAPTAIRWPTTPTATCGTGGSANSSCPIAFRRQPT